MSIEIISAATGTALRNGVNDPTVIATRSTVTPTGTTKVMQTGKPGLSPRKGPHVKHTPLFALLLCCAMLLAPGCIGRTHQSVGLGTKWKAWGLCRAIVNNWIDE